VFLNLSVQGVFEVNNGGKRVVVLYNAESMKISNKQFSNFLVIAKRATYASSGEGGERQLADGTKELVLKEGLYKYRDRYFGSNPFIGQEVVFYKKKAVWAMNYYGAVINNIADSKEVYGFLKQALLKVSKGEPYRGPNSFTEVDWRYSMNVTGTVWYFSGKETIYYCGKKAYTLFFHGGEIK